MTADSHNTIKLRKYANKSALIPGCILESIDIDSIDSVDSVDSIDSNSDKSLSVLTPGLGADALKRAKFRSAGNSSAGCSEMSDFAVCSLLSWNTHEIMACAGTDLTVIASRRVARYVLQSAARELLLLDASRKSPEDLRGGQYAERTAYCHRLVRPGANSVGLLHFPETSGAAYRGLIACASIWNCPVCSAKITERRREELSVAIGASPYIPVLMTFTLQHSKSDSLQDVLGALLVAYRKFFKGTGWTSARDKYGIVGRVRGLEVTHGDNGWHPHMHPLLLAAQGFDEDGFESYSKARWGGILSRLGKYATWENGVTVRASGGVLADYIAKVGSEDVQLARMGSGWTVVHELVKAPVKQGRLGGRTPLQLLADYVSGDEQAGELWLEYAAVFKGKKHLVWSRGLRALLGLGQEKTDVEVEEEDIEVAVLLGTLSFHDWKIIVGNDARGELLDVVATGDVDQLYAFLAVFGIVIEEVDNGPV